MPKRNINDHERTQAKRERNRIDYLASKKKQEPALLRLGLGERLILDQAAANAGLSRSAFAQLYLVPIASALTTERILALTQLTKTKKVALSTAIGALIDTHAASAAAEASPAKVEADVSLAFDSLFEVASSLPNNNPPAA